MEFAHGTGGGGGWHTSLTQASQAADELERYALQHPAHTLHVGRTPAQTLGRGDGGGTGGAGGAGVAGLGQSARVVHSPVAAHQPHSSPFPLVRKSQKRRLLKKSGSDVFCAQPTFMS